MALSPSELSHISDVESCSSVQARIDEATVNAGRNRTPFSLPQQPRGVLRGPPIYERIENRAELTIPAQPPHEEDSFQAPVSCDGSSRLSPSTLLENTASRCPASDMEKRLKRNKQRMVLMGQRRSGKSSIQSVVFHKMAPQETLFLESTTRIQKDTFNSIMNFNLWDMPGQLDYFDPAFDGEDIFSEVGALIWVIDAQDDYSDSLVRLTTTILNLQTTFPDIYVEVFVHKTDNLNEEYKTDVFEDIVQRVGDELNDAGYLNPNVSYHLTSIYDHTIFEAFSKVVQKLIPNLGTLQSLLNILVNSCSGEKAYLFDILTKLYVASDTRPVDMAVYEMCSDYIDVIVDITDLYGYPRGHNVVLGDQMDEAESSITIHDGTMIYLKEMNRHLCLVTVIKKKEAKDKKGLIDYNCHIFQEALNKVFAREWEKTPIEKGTGGASEPEVPSSSAQASLAAQLEGTRLGD